MSQESIDAAELLITLTADIVAAHVSNNSVAVSDVPTLIGNVHAALAGLSTEVVVVEAALEPAVPIRTSIKKDYIVCLEDGKKLKMLKRHLIRSCLRRTTPRFSKGYRPRTGSWVRSEKES